MKKDFFLARIYKNFRWQFRQYHVYQVNRNNFSAEYARIYYENERSRFRKKPYAELKKYQDRKDQYILNYLEETLSQVIEKHHKENESNKKRQNIVWTLWWDGEDTAPPIVKTCLSRMRRNSGGLKVVVLDKDTYLNYISLPDEIIQKHESGIIGHAHYSDIIRLSLLAKYGGVWLDATLFLTSPIPENVRKDRFYTCRSVQKDALYFSKSRWTGFLLSGDPNFPFFSFARDMLVEYWKLNNQAIDYLLMDYIFDIVVRNNSEVSDYLENMADNNARRNELMGMINAPFNARIYNDLVESDTFVQKLSWRSGNPVPYTRNGELTFYGYIQNLE